MDEYWPGCPATADYVRVWAMLAGRNEKHRQTVALGRALGLSALDAAETVATWTRWYAASGHPVSWTRIRNAVADRAGGDLWRPGEVSAGEMIRAGLIGVDERRRAEGGLSRDTPRSP